MEYVPLYCDIIYIIYLYNKLYLRINIYYILTYAQISSVNLTKNGQWPADKNELIRKHLEPFLTHIESIDFDRL